MFIFSLVIDIVVTVASEVWNLQEDASYFNEYMWTMMVSMPVKILPIILLLYYNYKTFKDAPIYLESSKLTITWDDDSVARLHE